MKLTELSPEWRYLYAGIVLAAAAVFLLSVQAVLSPLVAYVLLLVLLTPYAGTPRHTALVSAATLVLALWLLHTIGVLLAPFILAFVLAYIMDPAVDVLQRRGLRRGTAVIILVAPVLALLALALAFGIPALIAQLESLVARLPAAARRLADWLAEVRAGAAGSNLPFISDERVLGWLNEERITAYVAAQQDVIGQRIWGAISGVGRGIGVVVAVLGFMLFTPVLVIYLLRDFDRITERVATLLPDQRRARWLGFMGEYDSLLSRFLRGQVIEAALVGILVWLGLWALGVPYAGLIGVITGVFNLVPYLGFIVSIVPIVIVALLSGSFLGTLLRAGIVFLVVQTIDSTITGPRIVGGSVGLHPVWVILALAVGGAFLGFVGLLIAMPAAVLIKLLLREGVARYRRSAVFLGTAPPDSDIVGGT